jgi:hypothetical protein
VLFGSLIGPAVAVAALWLVHERHVPTLATAAVGVFSGTWLWNLMLNIRHAGVIDGDIAFAPFPISWQDTGTGIFSFAFATALLLATTQRNQPGHNTLKVAGIAAAAALIMDIYAW